MLPLLWLVFTAGIREVSGPEFVFLWPLIVLKDPNLYTLPIGLQFLKGQYTTDYGALMAMTLISVALLVVLFLAFQRFFVQGLATTGLK